MVQPLDEMRALFCPKCLPKAKAAFGYKQPRRRLVQRKDRKWTTVLHSVKRTKKNRAILKAIADFRIPDGVRVPCTHRDIKRKKVAVK